MQFDNTYSRLPDHFYEAINPTPVKSPKLIRINHALAKEMGIELAQSDEDNALLFSGNTLFPGSKPIAQVYAGHQFGHFVPQLGDGRAILLGELLNAAGTRYDMQLKGAGITRFSRNGDGRSPLGPVIREYVVSEAMHAMGVPTSRSLAMVETGESVMRETRQPGAILTRVAASHVRVGTFEFFAARKDEEAVRHLADYVIDRHYPDARQADNPYAELFRHVCHAQARLVAHWLSVGFIHGVMNTDNTTISGETIDYGPCAFMDAYNPAQVFSSIDHQGRYAYNNQSTIAQWNMSCLGGCLLPLFHEDADKGRTIGEEILANFPSLFKSEYHRLMSRKIGLATSTDDGLTIITALLKLMHQSHVDFTLAFRALSQAVTVENQGAFTALFSDNAAITNWLDSWRKFLGAETNREEIAHAMNSVNPVFIPRNHRIEEATRAAEDHGDFTPTHTLINILKQPFKEQPEYEDHTLTPKPDQLVHQTFCGT